MNSKGKLELRAAVLALAICAFPAAVGADIVVVTTTSDKGWFGLNEGPSGSLGETAFLPGPGTPPAGVGSVELRVDDEGRASFGTLQFEGTPLSVITELSYSSYSAFDFNLTTAWPSLQFDIDYDATDASSVYQGRLVFEPEGAAVPDAWIAHDALAGRWWATRQPGQAVCPQSAPCTWAEVLSTFPNAAVRSDAIQRGALLLRLGGPLAGGAVVNIDDLTISTGFPATTYDFEPGATVNPSVGPAGSLVAVEAYGFRALRNVRVFYYTNKSSNSRIKVCRTKTSLTGAFYCAVNLPLDPDAGPAGVHSVRIRGPRRIDYWTSFILTP